MTMNKAACFTDIHWGRKNNSERHNQDCLDFTKWFCDQVRADEEIDHVIFLGDWFEHRAAINSLTLEYAYKGACLIRDLGLPVYFIVGNHDLYYRTNREVASTNFFEGFGFNLIKDEPVVIEELGPRGAMLCPFLFEDEYPTLVKYLSTPVWFGHFEFKGFVITGDTKRMEHGPDAREFKQAKRIFSGHFHKRQADGNVTYIGNAFPADFSDANDFERGMMVYTYDEDDVQFIDWPDCPTYIKTTLSEIVDNPKILQSNSVVSCTVDMDITYEQSIELKEQLTEKRGLREIDLKENPERMAILEGTEVDDDELDDLDTTDEMVIAMLSKIEAETIDNNRLIKMYKGL